jgi:predicted nucleic acid-binding protein
LKKARLRALTEGISVNEGLRIFLESYAGVRAEQAAALDDLIDLFAAGQIAARGHRTLVARGASRAQLMRRFFCTNVFVYLFDASAPRKKTRAQELLKQTVSEGLALLSSQVLHEFFVAGARKLSVPLPREQAERAVRGSEHASNIAGGRRDDHKSDHNDAPLSAFSFGTVSLFTRRCVAERRLSTPKIFITAKRSKPFRSRIHFDA